MIKATEPAVLFIVVMLILHMGCGQGNDSSNIETSKHRPVRSMPKTDKTNRKATPVFDSLPQKAPYTLPQALAVTNAYAQQRIAVRVDSSGTRYGFWRIESDGKFSLTEWVVYGLFRDLLSTAASSNPSWSDLPKHQKPPKILNGQIIQHGEPIFDPTKPSDVGSLVAVFRSTLRIQDQKDIEGRFYLYKATADDLPVNAMFIPESKTEGDWAVVIGDCLLCSQVSRRSMTRTDLDGDGVTDTAFIAEGSNGCGEISCPLYWVVMLPTRLQSIGPIEDMMLFNTTSLSEMLDRCSKIKDFARARESLHWKMTAADLGLAISMSSPGCKMNWTFAKGADGRIRRQPDLPVQ
jgi:hypothetical protein